MNGYKCDKCGQRIYVDPGEPRICDTCAQQIRIRKQEQTSYYGNRQAITKGGEKHGEVLLLRDRPEKDPL